MTKEQLTELLGQVQNNARLQEQLKAAGNADAVISIAQNAGFQVIATNFNKDQSKLLEEELEGVNGGFSGGISGGNSGGIVVTTRIMD